ncbi:MAG: transposase [Candidatus Electronema sp. VV]
MLRQTGGHASQDHVRLSVSTPPQVTVSRFARRLKGKASHKLLSGCPHLRKTCRGRHFWARGCFSAAAAEKVTDEAVK